MEIGRLKIYQISLKLNRKIWDIYSKLSTDLKFNIGSQIFCPIDSIGANAAKGFGRFYYKDSISFIIMLAVSCRNKGIGYIYSIKEN